MRAFVSYSGALVALSFLGLARAQDADAPPPATTDVVASCVSQHEKARLSILSEDWPAAQEAANACAAEACPLALRSDCDAWRDDIEKALPTLLIVVERRAGSQPVALELDGRATPLTEPSTSIRTFPGRHRLVFSLPPFAPITQELTLQKGDKNHLVRVRFGLDERPPPAPFAIRTSRPVPWTTIVLSGGAVAGFATSTVLVISALTKRADARRQCAPVCDSGEASTIRARLLAADLTGGAGLVLAGLAVYSYWKRPVVRERVGLSLPSLTLDAEHAELRVGGRF